MLEFTIGAHTYKAGKLSAITQLHVARRLAPLLSSAGEVMLAQGDGGDAATLQSLDPMLRALGAMPDADVEYVLHACLDVVSREQDGGRGWARVRSASGGLMFDDIDMTVMLHIAWTVLRNNLSGFSNALRLGSSNAGQSVQTLNG